MDHTTELPLVASTDAAAHLTLLDDETLIRRSILPGGIRVLTQRVPAQRSVSLSVWCPLGSRDESDTQYGSSHFLEHLLFKGTRTRTAAQIANAFDAVGGETNAGTTKEYTFYWARTLAEDLPMATETLLDMITASTLADVEFERERGVILDELAMANDDAVEVAHEAFASAVFADHCLGRPIGGTVDSIRRTQRGDVWNYYQEHYQGRSIVVVAAGAVEHDQLCELVMQAVRRSGWELSVAAVPQPPRPVADTPGRGQAERKVVIKPGEQAHVIVGCRSLAANDDRRSTMSVMLTLLGGSMSSRLFQQIREKRGLAYTTYAFDHGYTDAGSFGMYAGCAPANVLQVEELMRAELADLASSGAGEDELRRVKGQLRGGIALGLEDSSARMTRLGIAEVVHHRFTPLERTLARIENTTGEDIARLASDLLEEPECVATVLPGEVAGS